MASIAIKGISTLATAGAIGGVTYGVHTLNDTTDTVRNYLTKNGFEVIEQSAEDSLWTKSNDAYQFEKIDGLTLKPDNKEGVKAWCKDTLEKTIKSKEEADYKNATKLCVKFDSIKDKLSKGLQTDVKTLNGKLESFIQKIKEEITKVVADGTDKVGTQIKTWCEKNAKRRNSEENKTYLEQIEKNCLVSE